MNSLKGVVISGTVGEKRHSWPLKPFVSEGMVLHRNTAKKLIEELQDQKNVSYAIELSKTYQVACRHTSFVAVAHETGLWIVETR